jgi:hypothetical protein
MLCDVTANSRLLERCHVGTTSRDRIVYDTKEDLVVCAISAYARASNRAALVLRKDMLFHIPDACTRRGFTGVANLVEIQLLKVFGTQQSSAPFTIGLIAINNGSNSPLFLDCAK